MVGPQNVQRLLEARDSLDRLPVSELVVSRRTDGSPLLNAHLLCAAGRRVVVDGMPLDQTDCLDILRAPAGAKLAFTTCVIDIGEGDQVSLDSAPTISSSASSRLC